MGEGTCETQRGEGMLGELEDLACGELKLLTASTVSRGVDSRMPPEGEGCLPLTEGMLATRETPRGVDHGGGFWSGPRDDELEPSESLRSFSESDCTVTSI